MTKLLFDPLSILLLLVAGIVVFFYLGNEVWAQRIGMAAVVWLFIISSSPIPRWLVRSLESSYKVYNGSNLDSKEPHILILGGGHTQDPDLPFNNQLSTNALGRLVEGIRIYRFIQNSKLVLSGYTSTDKMSQAEILARTALLLNVDEADTLMNTTPKNTRQEAKHYFEKFGNNHPLILVTDAAHMPRAMMWFKKYGLDPIPAPTNNMVKTDPYKSSFIFKPSIGNLGMMRRAMIEYSGILYFKLFA